MAEVYATLRHSLVSRSGSDGAEAYSLALGSYSRRAGAGQSTPQTGGGRARAACAVMGLRRSGMSSPTRRGGTIKRAGVGRGACGWSAWGNLLAPETPLLALSTEAPTFSKRKAPSPIRDFDAMCVK